MVDKGEYHEFHVTESPFGRQFLPYSASAFSMTTCKPFDVYIFLKDLEIPHNYRFLRGGPVSFALSTQDDQLKDHKHTDMGHKHTDDGHRHQDGGHAHGTNPHRHGYSERTPAWGRGRFFNILISNQSKGPWPLSIKNAPAYIFTTSLHLYPKVLIVSIQN